MDREELQADLEENYVKPGHPIAFAGINVIYQHYNRQLPVKIIKDVIYKILSYSRHKETDRPKTNPYFIYKKRKQFQIDTVDISRFSDFNDGYKYLLTCIDVFTKKAFVRALKTKSANEVIVAFKSILTEAKIPPKTIFADKGSEIKNTKFKKLCRENNIKLMHAENEVHGAVVERFNRSLQVLCYKYITQTDIPRYIPQLQNIVKTYNSRYHRSIKMSPDEAEKPENQKRLFETRNLQLSKVVKKYKSKKPNYNIGDHVRVKRWKHAFNRGYEEQFSEEIFIITKVLRRKPIVTYVLKDLLDEKVAGSWYENELSRTITQDVFKIEKIIKWRNRGRKRQALVKWRGYNEKFNSWVDESDIP